MNNKRQSVWIIGNISLLLLLACNLGPNLTTIESTETPIITKTDAHTKPTEIPATTATPEPGIWGRLANPGFENERIKTTLFFPGQARDSSQRYDCHAGPNTNLFTVHPSDQKNLNWSAIPTNRDFVISEMLTAGLNVVSMSSWGEDFLSCDVGWSHIAPMQASPGSHDELFIAANGKPLLIMPFIESRNDWAFRDEFPRTSDNHIAPGTISQIVNLIERYLQDDSHPEWASSWAQAYDKNGESRYAVVLIHASSNRLSPSEHEPFAVGFDLIAEEIFQRTGVKIGFLIDPLQPYTHAPGWFKPTPESTGPFLAQSNSILGIQSFIPEIWFSGSPTDANFLTWKESYSRRWAETGIPFLMDISPGYDAHIVFPNSYHYGLTPAWQEALTSMVRDFGQDGLVFNSWNGYTEGMAAVPTIEFGDQYYRWLQEACQIVDSQ